MNLPAEGPNGSIVVIGASAGGVSALKTVVGGLPSNLNATVFVVLHISPDSPSLLASVLQRVTTIPIIQPVDGERIKHGCIYVAISDRHLVIERGVIRVTRGPRECRSRPAIDVLFRSAAAAYGEAVIGVVLTGALDDGTAGLWAVKHSHGVALVQDPETAEYDSMPRSAMQHVAVDAALPLRAIADEIVRRIPRASDVVAEPTAAQRVEVTIALEGNGLQAGVMQLGSVSPYTCPECHGVLVEINEGKIVRFRCHTGHAYTIKTLLAEVNESVDRGLWATLRALEERILLLRQMANLAAAYGDKDAAATAEVHSAAVDKRVKLIRELLLDPALTNDLLGDAVLLRSDA